MLDEQNNDEIIINPSSPEDPPVRLYENNTDANEEKRMEVDIEAFNTSVAITACDLFSKVNVFLNVYGDTLRKFKEERPEEWNKMLEQARKEYAEGSPNLDNVIELISALSVEYETLLKANKIDSIISKKLFDYLHPEQSVRIFDNTEE